MDLAQTLLKMATRAFYDTRQIIAVDAVMTHSWFVPCPAASPSILGGDSLVADHVLLRSPLAYATTSWRTLRR